MPQAPETFHHQVKSRLDKVSDDLRQVSLHIPPRMHSVLEKLLEICVLQQKEIERLITLTEDDNR